jgi:choline-glycine betaine transporter
MGLGVMQIGAGIDFIFGVTPNRVVWLIIISVLIVAYMISSYTGVDKGIRIMSRFNVYLFLFFMAFMLFLGPTIPIVNTMVTGLGVYLANIIPWSFHIDPFGASGWHGGWSIFYWAWWLSFAPMIGMFLARIAYGRTLRMFVMINLIAPALFGAAWFSIFGGGAIYLDRFMGTDIAGIIARYGTETSLYALFMQLPLSQIMLPILMLSVGISFITLADSITTMLGSLACKGFGAVDGKAPEPPAVMKFFWGILMGALALVLLNTGGLSALQTSSIVVALPIFFIKVFLAIAFIKAMRNIKDYDVVSSPALIAYLTELPLYDESKEKAHASIPVIEKEE